MNRAEIRALMKKGRECCAALERETAACLTCLESYSSSELDRFTAARRELVAEVREVTAHLSRLTERTEPAPDDDTLRDLAIFRQHTAASIRRVMEYDGLLVALGTSMLDRQRAELAALANGRQALSRYAGGRGPQAGAVSRTA